MSPEVASACLTGLSASMILLFAIDGDQTWSGYQILFRHWRITGVVREIRERLQLVGAMIPEVGADDYFDGLRERAWDIFSEELYDEVPAGAISTEGGSWSFDEADEGAPHSPWSIRWHRSFAAFRSLHGRLSGIDGEDVYTIFGPLIDGLMPLIEVKFERLPPEHYEKGWNGVRGDLGALGIFESMKDGRINMPDLYRVGFGLGRRGRVKPVISSSGD